MLSKYQIPAIIWALIILILTLTPGEHLPSLQLGKIMIDKFLHFMVFMVLSFLAIAGLQADNNSNTNGLWRKMLGICMGYGILMETLQYVVPGRHIDLFDLVANLVGCGAGMWLFIGYQKVVRSLAKK